MALLRTTIDDTRSSCYRVPKGQLVHSNQLIISPVFMSSVKLNRFLEDLQQLEVVCEVW